MYIVDRASTVHSGETDTRGTYRCRNVQFLHGTAVSFKNSTTPYLSTATCHARRWGMLTPETDSVLISILACFFIMCVVIVISVIRISVALEASADAERPAARKGSSGRMITMGRAHGSKQPARKVEPSTAAVARHSLRVPKANIDDGSSARAARKHATRATREWVRAASASDFSSSMSHFERTRGEKMCNAAADGDLRSLRTLLVDMGVSVNAGNYDGRRALHLAAAEGHREVVKFLLKCRADVNAQDRWGGTPMQDATRGGHKRVEKMLQRAGAMCSQRSWSAKTAQEAYSSQPLQMLAKIGSWAIASDEINLVARIGQGAQGKVYKAAWRGMSVVVKTIKNSHAALDDELFENEIMVMSTLRHPNLVLFLGAVLDGPKKMLVTEYLEQGSLLDLYVHMWHTSEAPFLPRVEVLCSSLNSPLLICGVPSDLIAV